MRPLVALIALLAACTAANPDFDPLAYSLCIERGQCEQSGGDFATARDAGAADLARLIDLSEPAIDSSAPSDLSSLPDLITAPDLATTPDLLQLCGRKACAFPHATAICANDTCFLGACDAGFADCDGMPGNGCEVNTGTDPKNCGGCGMGCSMAHLDAVACVAGDCVGNCSAGFGDCDGDKRKNGCETPLSNDASNCGGCGVKCDGGRSCLGAMCQPCGGWHEACCRPPVALCGGGWKCSWNGTNFFWCQ